MKLLKRAGITGLIVLSIAIHSNAQDLSDALRPFRGVSGLGARALALGGAYTAVSNDYTATFWNPAGLTQLNKSSVYSSMGHLIHDADISYDGKPASVIEGSYTNLNAVGAAIKVPTSRGSLVWAFGWNKLHSFENSLTAQNVESDLNVDLIEGGGIHSWTGAMGIEITPRISFGASLNWLRGNDNYDMRIVENALSTSEVFSPSYNGLSLIFGGLLRGDIATLGISVTAPTVYDIDDEWNVSIDDADSSFSEAGNNEYRVTLPFKFNVGLSSNVGNLLWAADLHIVDFSQINFESDILADGESIDGSINRDIAGELTTSVGYGVGVEYLLPFADVKLRFGVSNTPSPYKNDDGGDDRFAVSTGIGVLLDRQVKLDMTYVRTSWERSFSSNFLTKTINEDAVDGRLLFSVSYRY